MTTIRIEVEVDEARAPEVVNSLLRVPGVHFTVTSDRQKRFATKRRGPRVKLNENYGVADIVRGLDVRDLDTSGMTGEEIDGARGNLRARLGK